MTPTTSSEHLQRLADAAAQITAEELNYGRLAIAQIFAASYAAHSQAAKDARETERANNAAALATR